MSKRRVKLILRSRLEDKDLTDGDSETVMLSPPVSEPVFVSTPEKPPGESVGPPRPFCWGSSEADAQVPESRELAYRLEAHIADVGPIEIELFERRELLEVSQLRIVKG